MTATYDPDDLATSALFRVRLELGDTATAAALLQDEEIAYLLTATGNDEDATLVRAARILLNKYGTQPKSVRLPDGTSADFSDRVAIWQGVIVRLDTTSSGFRINRVARPQALGGSEYT